MRQEGVGTATSESLGDPGPIGVAVCTAEQNDRWEIFKNLKNSRKELKSSILAASPGQGSYAEVEPDSKISGLLWGVFSHHHPELLGKAALVSSLRSDSVRICQTECRCTLLTESGLRMDPLNLVPYLPRAEWSLGPGDQGWLAMLGQVLKEYQTCTRRCVVSLFSSCQELPAWALNRCMEL